MSLQKLEPEFIEKCIQESKDTLERRNSLLAQPVVNEEGRRDLLYGTSLSAFSLGLWYITAQDYIAAKENFVKTLHYQDEWVDGEKPGSFSFYAYALQRLYAASFTLDRDIIEKVATELEPLVDIVPRNGWESVVKILVGVILNYDNEAMGRLKAESEKTKHKRTEAIASLNVMWTFLENDLASFKENLNTVIKSNKHQYPGKIESSHYYIASLATMLVIISLLKDFNLQDYDPSMVPMDYLNSNLHKV